MTAEQIACNALLWQFKINDLGQVSLCSVGRNSVSCLGLL